MQRKIGTEIELGSSYGSIDASSAIDRTASNYKDAGDKVRKIRKLIETGTYDANIARYISSTLDLVFQGTLEDRYKRTLCAFLVQRHGKPRFSDSFNRQLLHKPEQHALVLYHKN